MPEQRSSSPARPVSMAIGLALVVHALLLLTDALPAMLRAWEEFFPRPAVEEPTQVEMVSMTPTQFEQNRLLADQVPEIEPPPEPEPPPPEPEAPKPSGQIVDLAPTPDDTPPIETRFLSEHNTRVKEEMVSPDPDPSQDKPAPRPTLAKADPKPEVQPPAPEEPKPAPQPEPEEAEPEPEEVADADSDALFEVPKEPEGQPELEAADGDQAPSPEGEPAPSAADAARDVAMAEAGEQARPEDEAGAPMPDHIRGVKTGPATFLNSREFMYATFFNRVKRLVSQSWYPSVRDTLDRRDTVGRGPTRDELITLVRVSVEPDGDLEKVELVRSSGVAMFDNLALKAFHQAAPFPNPPQGLIGPDGRIRFNFGFTISERLGPTTHAFRPRRIR